MNILVACECSGRVRDAFTALGHKAVSADILPSETPGLHYQGSVIDIIDQRWDMLIAFPPCTYLAVVGNRHWHQPGRALKRAKAFLFVAQLWSSSIPKVCIENPAGLLTHALGKPTQTINPYFFGEPHRKKTSLWLRNLPSLPHTSTQNLFFPVTHCQPPKPISIEPSGKPVYFVDQFNTAATRSHLRAKTFISIANAMASTWG